jgi:5-methyltetrahydropteroyltriglutamate--homocysteine methyltransferase
MEPILDDVGSFPLPEGITKDRFAEVYPRVQEAMGEGLSLEDIEGFHDVFYSTVSASLRFKVDAGLDVVNYPQHYDMHQQFLEPIQRHQTEPFLIDAKYAWVPEVHVAEGEAKRIFEETGEGLKLKVCVTGPIELYLKCGFGYTVYDEILFNLARSVNSFIKNAILDLPHIKTEVVAIDEPSLGFVDLLNIEEEGLVSALDEALKGVKPRVQIHLHTLKAAEIPLECRNIDCLTGEFAATPMNMKLISRETLESHDKFIRAGITRTNIDTIIAEGLEKGQRPKDEDLVDSLEEITTRYKEAKEVFGERMAFAGPDCGLGSWPSQEVAHLLLKRTVEAARASGTD